MSIMEAVISTQAAVPEITPMPSSDVHDPTHTSEPAAASNRGPIPMSFPAVLRTAGLTDRYAHLRVPSAVGLSPPARSRMPKRDENEGKRWIRRRENAQFVGNAHIAAATKQDYSVPVPSSRTTFPQPLPSYLHSNNHIPPVKAPAREPISANAGRFSLSLKGMRKELRKTGPRTEVLVKEIEHEVLSWLGQGIWLSPDARSMNLDPALGSAIGSMGVITEVSRTPSQLVWSIRDDSFVRATVGMITTTETHGSPVPGKDASGSRLTYLLSPQSAQSSISAPIGLETPPATDLESSVDAESEFTFSDRGSHLGSDVDSDLEGAPPRGAYAALSDIAESTPASPALVPENDDTWSMIGESDVEGGDERELTQSVSTLNLDDTEITSRAPLRLRQTPLGSHLWEHRRRSASSPSRSPARRNPPRAHPRRDPPRVKQDPRSFYDYLFS